MRTYYPRPPKAYARLFQGRHSYLKGRFYPALGEDPVHNVDVLTRSQAGTRKTVYLQDIFPPEKLHASYPRRVIITVRIKSRRTVEKKAKKHADSEGGIKARLMLFYRTDEATTYNHWLAKMGLYMWRTPVLAMKLSKANIKSDWISGKTMRNQDFVDWDDEDDIWANKGIEMLAKKVLSLGNQPNAKRFPTRFSIYV